MAKLYRYMSFEEFDKVMRGETIVGSDHRMRYMTNSVGVCFLSDPVVIMDEHRKEIMSVTSPERSLEFLGGIVTSDILVEFEVPNLDEFRKGYGIYDGEIVGKDIISAEEFSIIKYNKDSLIPTRFIEPDIFERDIISFSDKHEIAGWVDITPELTAGDKNTVQRFAAGGKSYDEWRDEIQLENDKLLEKDMNDRTIEVLPLRARANMETPYVDVIVPRGSGMFVTEEIFLISAKYDVRDNELKQAFKGSKAEFDTYVSMLSEMARRNADIVEAKISELEKEPTENLILDKYDSHIEAVGADASNMTRDEKTFLGIACAKYELDIERKEVLHEIFGDAYYQLNRTVIFDKPQTFEELSQTYKQWLRERDVPAVDISHTDAQLISKLDDICSRYQTLENDTKRADTRLAKINQIVDEHFEFQQKLLSGLRESIHVRVTETLDQTKYIECHKRDELREDLKIPHPKADEFERIMDEWVEEKLSLDDIKHMEKSPLELASEEDLSAEDYREICELEAITA